MDEQDISFNYIVLYYLGVNEPTYGNGVSLDVLEKGAEKGADVRNLAKGGPSDASVENSGWPEGTCEHTMRGAEGCRRSQFRRKQGNANDFICMHGFYFTKVLWLSQG